MFYKNNLKSVDFFLSWVKTGRFITKNRFFWVKNLLVFGLPRAHFWFFSKKIFICFLLVKTIHLVYWSPYFKNFYFLALIRRYPKNTKSTYCWIVIFFFSYLHPGPTIEKYCAPIDFLKKGGGKKPSNEYGTCFSFKGFVNEMVCWF